MNPLSPIPTPPSRRWKDFRLQGLPVLAFAMVGVAIFYLWNRNLGPTTITGEVESVRKEVASPIPGRLADLTLDTFQAVREGDPVATVITTDPRVIEASLAVIRGEVELLKTGMDPVLNQHRDAVNYQQLRLAWLVQRVDLASARVRLQFAENELERVGKLYEEKIVPKGIPQGQNQNGVTGYDVAMRDRDALRTEVDERAKVVAEIEQKLQELKVPRGWESPQVDGPAISAAIALQDDRLRLTEAQLNPVILKAPMSGVVSQVLRRSGETVVAGQPIISIAAAQSQHIIGYMRQPLPFEPKVGDAVRVYTRRPHRQRADARIVQVGAEMELVSAPMRLRGYTTAMERGLPIMLDMPAGLQVRPGELVDLMIQPSQ
jgi:multidrug resistance efflux pump